MKKGIILFIIYISIISFAQAQPNSLKENADNAFQLGRYEYAKELYVQLELRQPDDISKFPFLKQIALCYKYLNRPVQSLSYFQRALDIYPKFPDSVNVEYAEILVLTGNYNAAKEVLKNLEKNLEKVQQLNQQIAYAISNSTFTNVTVRSIHNQPAIQNYGITNYNGELAKILPYSVKTNYYNYTKIYLNNSEVESRINNEVTKLNNFSYPTFDTLNSVIYFTANATNSSNYSKTLRKLQRISKEGENNLFIYKLIYNKSNEVPETMPFNNVEYSCMHPTISKNGEVMFFVSDMPGGSGGFDIYYVKKLKSGWSDPINMGDKVNTNLNEGYPFLLDNILYFSSRGHQGYGGLDIFTYNIQTSELKNLGKPINSSFDDFNYILTSEKKGYFISNREKTVDLDQIYEVQFNR